VVNYLYSGAGKKAEERLEESNGVLIQGRPYRDPEAVLKRGDVIVLALRTLARDPGHILFGLGLGNISVSSLKGFSGKYSEIYGRTTGRSALSHILWELGVLGVVWFLGFLFLILIDTLRLFSNPGFTGTLARGWTVAPVSLILCMAYVDFISHNVIGYIFFYFSGYIVSQKV